MYVTYQFVRMGTKCQKNQTCLGPEALGGHVTCFAFGWWPSHVTLSWGLNQIRSLKGVFMTSLTLKMMDLGFHVIFTKEKFDFGFILEEY